MNDRAMRIGLLLGVIPAVFYIGWVISAQTSSCEVGCFCATLISCGLVLWIWRPYVRWSRGAALKIGAITLLMFGQILFWRPMWATTGCGKEAYDNIQCLSQTAILLAGWCVGCALSWWGALLWRRVRRSTNIPTARLTMTPNIVRLSIGLALIPFLPAVFCILFIALDKFGGLSGNGSWFVAYEFCALIAVCTWTFLWRKSALPLIGRTALVALPILTTPFAVFLYSSSPVIDSVYKLSPIIALGIWFAGTAMLWRRPEERITVTGDAESAAPTCPTCNYNLTGLREVRCPECGWASTVDEIVQRHLALAIVSD